MSNSKGVKAYSLLPITIGLIALASAITYFSITLHLLSQEIGAIVSEIKPIASDLRFAAEQVSKVGEQVPSIVQEVELIRENIPDILMAVKQTQELVPSIIDETAAIRATVTPVLEELEDYEQIITASTMEITRVRESLPQTLAHLERIVQQADEAGKNVTEGVATNIVSGFFKAPFKLVGGIGNGLLANKKLSTADRKMLEEKILGLIENGEEGNKISFSSKESRLKGEIKITNTWTEAALTCQKISLSSNLTKKIVKNLCKNKEGQWQEQEKNKELN